jgi:hypothetical protein
VIRLTDCSSWLDHPTNLPDRYECWVGVQDTFVSFVLQPRYTSTWCTFSFVLQPRCTSTWSVWVLSRSTWHVRYFCASTKISYIICTGLARTVYIHHIWPYIWWFPCQKYRIYTVYIWFWPTLHCIISYFHVSRSVQAVSLQARLLEGTA